MSARSRPLVFCYHAVSTSWSHDFAIDPTVLERQLRLVLRFGYQGAGLQQLLSERRRLVHVTFDDGYESVSRAVPTLERLGVPATIFVCPAYVDGGLVTDTSLADEARAHPTEFRTITWDGLRELSAKGYEIGSHSLTHARLTETTDPELSRQLGESRARVEAELGRPCRYLSYPNGAQDARVRAAAQKAGYEAAFVVTRTRGVSGPYAVPRVGVYRKDGRARFWIKTSPFLSRVGLPLLESTRRLRRGVGAGDA